MSEEVVFEVGDDSIVFEVGEDSVAFVVDPVGLPGPVGPVGEKGEKGDNFTVNATGVLSQRVAYDSQPKGFSFLATDEGNLYIKNTGTSGDWSSGIPFQGPKGEKGDAGAPGQDGVQGPPGVGVPAGGEPGQILSKASDLDRDTAWIDPPASGAGSWDELTDKPEAFPPEPHEHALVDVTGLPETLEGKEDAGAAADAVAVHEAAADPHPQYATQAEAADAAPVQSVAGKTGIVVLTLADIAGLQASLDGKEPAIGVKGTAFNKSFGTVAGSVCAGDDARLSNPRTPTSHAASHADGGSDEIITPLDPRAYPLLAGLLSARPAAGVAGRMFFASDKLSLARDDGAAWTDVGHGGEFGSWTPVLAGFSTAGSNTYDAAYTAGYYYRLGKLVFVQGRVKVTAVSGMSGALTISGLPFVVATRPVANAAHAMVAGTLNGFSGIASGNVPVLQFAQNSTLVFVNLQSNTSLSNCNSSSCVAGSDVQFAGCYLTT